MDASEEKSTSNTATEPGQPLDFAIPNWNVVDVESFIVLKDAGNSLRKIAVALGSSRTAVTSLLEGTHWQQRPKRVVMFNNKMGTDIDPETGFASKEVLEKYSFRAKTEQKEIEAKNREVELVKKGAAEMPFADITLDDEFFIGQLNIKAAIMLESLTEEEIKKASVRDRVNGASTLLEKRNLLMDRPTQRISFEQREKLNEVLPELIKEAQRRGLDIEGVAEDVTDREPVDA